jgi:uncharacterized protein (DUF488 family)
MGSLRVHTLGHSTRSLDELISLLREHGIAMVVDVRRFPGSRRYPHFSKDALQASLAEVGIAYTHKVELGGRRSGRADSPNTAWRNASFRAYADHMDSPEFQAGLAALVELAKATSCVLVCAEVLPHRCHRRLIADALVIRGAEVIHILGPRRTERHVLNPSAHVLDDGRIRYVDHRPLELGLSPAEFLKNCRTGTPPPRVGVRGKRPL